MKCHMWHYLTGGWPQKSATMTHCMVSGRDGGRGIPPSRLSLYNSWRTWGRRSSTPYSWTYRRRMMSWTRTCDLIYWWDTAWVLGCSGSCGRTGIGCRWWRSMAATFSPPPPLQGLPWGDTGRPFPPHNFQRGNGSRNRALGDGGGTNRGWSRGTQGDDIGVGGFFICRWWDSCVAPDVEVAEGLQGTYRYLWPGRSPHKHT